MNSNIVRLSVKNIGIEKIFIDQKLDFICRELPELKITLEHITTKQATEYIGEGNKNLAASITPHHLALNRNAIFALLESNALPKFNKSR